MQRVVRVIVSADQDFRFELSHEQTMANDVARQWLDEQFVALDCEPLRASGKLLMVDKVLVVAQEAGAKLLADPAWGIEFAKAASASLGKPVVTIDIATMSVTY
jgi:hypothetical protein